jgi:hypothetical protein
MVGLFAFVAGIFALVWSVVIASVGIALVFALLIPLMVVFLVFRIGFALMRVAAVFLLVCVAAAWLL